MKKLSFFHTPIHKFIIFYCPLDREHTRKVWFLFEKAREKEETFPVKFLINIRKFYTGLDTIFQPVRSVRTAAWRSRRGY